MDRTALNCRFDSCLHTWLALFDSASVLNMLIILYLCIFLSWSFFIGFLRRSYRLSS